MSVSDAWIFGGLGVLGVGVLAYLWRAHVSPAARDRRRREHNYGRVASQARRPMVRFSVRTKKK